MHTIPPKRAVSLVTSPTNFVASIVQKFIDVKIWVKLWINLVVYSDIRFPTWTAFNRKMIKFIPIEFTGSIMTAPRSNNMEQLNFLKYSLVKITKIQINEILLQFFKDFINIFNWHVTEHLSGWFYCTDWESLYWRTHPLLTTSLAVLIVPSL